MYKLLKYIKRRRTGRTLLIENWEEEEVPVEEEMGIFPGFALTFLSRVTKEGNQEYRRESVRCKERMCIDERYTHTCIRIYANVYMYIYLIFTYICIYTYTTYIKLTIPYLRGKGRYLNVSRVYEN